MDNGKLVNQIAMLLPVAVKRYFSMQVMKSLEVGHWVDEEPYELSDAFPAAQVGSLLCLLGAYPFSKIDLRSQSVMCVYLLLG